MIRKLFALAALALALPMLADGAHAQDGRSSYSFTGICSDCAGVGVGTLTLRNYDAPTDRQLTAADFVEFTYTSDLLPAVDITSVDSLSGSLSFLPGANTVFFYSAAQNFAFASYALTSDYMPGSWCLGASCLADFGPAHVWQAVPTVAGDVPEPAAWALMLLGFGGVGAMLRRRAEPALA